jgi:hypothetical protein
LWAEVDLIFAPVRPTVLAWSSLRQPTSTSDGIAWTSAYRNSVSKHYTEWGYGHASTGDLLKNAAFSPQPIKTREVARREQHNKSLKVLLEGLERGLVSTLTTIGSITEDRALSGVEKVTRIRALLATRETQRLLEKDPIVELKASLASELGEDEYYKILESKSVWIQNRVNPVLKALTFQAGPSVRKLVDAIEHFKEKDGAVDKSAPAGFLNPEEGAALQKEGKFRVSLYKALLFQHVRSGIKSGALNLEHSYKYRPLDDYLIDRVRWQRDKQHLIERAGRESAYVIDWLTRNEVMKSDIHSIDAFGFSELVFAVSHLSVLLLRTALQKSQAPEALYLQESQGLRPFRLEDQARRLC